MIMKTSLAILMAHYQLSFAMPAIEGHGYLYRASIEGHSVKYLALIMGPSVKYLA
jgi:hypothetical protein